ncbi:mitochondrial lysine-tRNA synthetase [Neonectria magnoliae]|uniref:Lysyl-tRNA synthetase n=1 Tax=Neonectria magnoliae TaxID=2732573 RepID=A0ABR1IAB6_9HYPO
MERKFHAAIMIAPEESFEDLSPFKTQRRTVLWEEQQSEDPLYPESHPRLEHKRQRYSVPEFIEAFDAIEHAEMEEVTVYGRVRSKRAAGKYLIFLDIVNEFERLQVMVNRTKCMGNQETRKHKFAMFRNLIEVGDHISITGVPTRTKAGQLTIAATELPELLSPAMEQIPEKLTDPKTRMQERHVDMLVNREAIDVLRLRSEITKHMRDHFHSKRFLEFQTPILAENAGGAVARPFVTQATEFKDRDLALRIAPELWLKRLVIGGVDKVFEIGPAFRNEGIDGTHNPEFTMCEFYSAYSNLNDLIKETEDILYSLAEHSQNLISTQLTSLPPIDLEKFKRPYKRIEFVPALEEALGLRLPKLSAQGALPELLAILKLSGIKVPGEVPNSLSKLLDRLAAMYLEPMSFEQPILIMNHPACMSPLAKSFLCPQTYQLISARAELFIGGRELANMYEEENDPEAQKQKLLDHRNLVNKPDGTIAIEEPEVDPAAVEAVQFEDDDGDCAPLDQSFIKALDYGLPPTGGWGCGVERMVMLFSGANRISDCLSFGTLRNVVGLSAAEETKKAGAVAEDKTGGKAEASR